MSKTVIITRMFSDERGVISRLNVHGKDISFTIERPWLDNEVNVSCIPVGVYTMYRCSTSKTMPSAYKGVTYGVKVDGRSQIKLHVANKPSELQGCLAPNMAADFLNMQGSNSATATERFMDAMDGVDTATLIVKEV